MIVSFIFNTHVDLYFVASKKRIVTKFRSGYNVFATAFCFAVLGGRYFIFINCQLIIVWLQWISHKKKYIEYGNKVHSIDSSVLLTWSKYARRPF